MSLVTAKEVAKAIKVHKYGFVGTFIGWLLLRVTKISNINRFYDNHKHLEGIDFLNAILEYYEINYDIPDEDFKRLPKDGAYITISNHPLGGMDGVLLLKLLVGHRADYKIIANFLLHRIQPMARYIMPVNPFENHKDAKSSIAGFKSAMRHLREGHPLGIFPAGEVSTHKDGKLIVDKPWVTFMLRIVGFFTDYLK